MYAACKKQTSGEAIMIALAILLLRHRLPSGGGRHGGGGGGGGLSSSRCLVGKCLVKQSCLKGDNHTIEIC